MTTTSKCEYIIRTKTMYINFVQLPTWKGKIKTHIGISFFLDKTKILKYSLQEVVNIIENFNVLRNMGGIHLFCWYLGGYLLICFSTGGYCRFPQWSPCISLQHATTHSVQSAECHHTCSAVFSIQCSLQHADTHAVQSAACKYSCSAVCCRLLNAASFSEAWQG